MAQDLATQPHTASVDSPKPGPAIAYEAATLPKDREAAWEMLRAANGLHGDSLQPWSRVAHYKTYDAYGKSKDEGTLEYVWENKEHWYVTYKESSKVWTRWRTPLGLYAPANESESPGYPESLITGYIRNPLEHLSPTQVPPYLGDEPFSQITLSCFRNEPLAGASQIKTWNDLSRVCSVQHRPVLRFLQDDYSAYFNKSAVFQHQIVAQDISVRENVDPVVDIEITSLKSPDAAQLTLLAPPGEAVLISDTTPPLPTEKATGHTVHKEQPEYPAEMKAQRVQGNVRLAVRIGKDGHVTITDVLHSPNPALTKSSEQAASHWVYAPFLKDGQPVEVETTIVTRFRLN